MLPALRARLLAVEDAASAYANATAVVAVILREREGLEVLVMERARRASDPWSGHWSFPGGRRHADESLLDAVCRETGEEVGLDVRGSSPLGCMPARSPGNRPGILVLPFVFQWEGTAEPRAGAEATTVRWVPVAELRRTRTETDIRIRGRVVRMPAFVDGTRTIWGFTYRVLEDLLALLPQ